MDTAEAWLVKQEDQLYTGDKISGLVFRCGELVDLILPVTAMGDDYNLQACYFRWSLTQQNCADLLKRWKAHQELVAEWTDMWSINWGDAAGGAMPYEQEPWLYLRDRLFGCWREGHPEGHIDTTLFSYNGGFFWQFRQTKHVENYIDWECQPVSPKVLENVQTAEIPPEGLFMSHLEG